MMYQMSDDDHAGNEKCAHADHRIMEIKQSGQRKQCKRKNASVKMRLYNDQKKKITDKRR